MKTILTINAGSSSIKYSIYDELAEDDLKEQVKGLIEGIGETVGQWKQGKVCEEITFATHQDAFTGLLERLGKQLSNQITVVAHRVVHGGDFFNQPIKIDESVIEKIEELSSLAPLHNPANVTGIKYARQLFFHVPHIAVFDTAFHSTMPALTRTYPIDLSVSHKYHIKKYGFHGINHQYVAEMAANYLKKPLNECNLITLHLGNGASCCLIKQGKSYDTSMGFTPLPGLMMGSRCGDIDPSIIPFLYEQGYSMAAINNLLNRKSGLIGIAGDNDMRRLLTRQAENDERATLAIDMFCYQLQKYIAAYVGQLPAMDGLIFTGGIGENAAPIRLQAIEPLAHLGLEINPAHNIQARQSTITPIGKSAIPILVISGDEEKAMVSQTLTLL